MSQLIVADAGPLHYVILLDQTQLLEIIFDQVWVPQAVRQELLHVHAPAKVRAWITSPPPWLAFAEVSNPVPIEGVDAGESEAIQLALQMGITAVLMDDYPGRRVASKLGLAPMGTIGLLERGAERGLVTLSAAFDQLRQTNFRISPELMDAALQRDRDRRPHS